MRLKASFTIENAWIVPVFTLIMVALISLSLHIHDSIICENALWIAGMKIEQEVGKNRAHKKVPEGNGIMDTGEKSGKAEVLSNAKEYIAENVIAADPGKYSEEVLYKEIQNGKIKSNYQPDFIRAVQAGKKLIGK